MKKPTKIVLDPDTYPVKVLIWLGKWSDSAVHAFAKRNGFGGKFTPPTPDNAACHWDMGPGSLIWLPRFPRTAFERGMLAHESVHAAASLGRYLGFELTPASEEFYTYLTGYIVSEVHRLCK